MTPRQFFAVVMFIVLVQKKALSIDKYFKIYLVFIASFVLGDVIFGLYGEAFRRLLGFYFVAFTAYQATKHLVVKYNAQKWLVYTFLSVAVIDAAVTIGFMYGLPFAPIVRSYLHIEFQNEFLEKMASRNLDTLAGWSVPGLLQTVDNGYFLCITTVIAHSLFSKKINLINYACWLVILFALFCVQERTAFYVGSFFSVLIIFRNNLRQDVSDGRKMLFLLVVLVVLFFALPTLVSTLVSEDSRYALDADFNNERGRIIKQAMPFVSSNPLGGWDYFASLGMSDPHNLVLNALVFGGWIGGFLILFLICKQSFEVFVLAKRKDYYLYYPAYIWGISYISYTLNSVTHNLSIVHGDPTIWILWGAFVANRELAKAKGYNIVNIQ